MEEIFLVFKLWLNAKFYTWLINVFESLISEQSSNGTSALDSPCTSNWTPDWTLLKKQLIQYAIFSVQSRDQERPQEDRLAALLNLSRRLACVMFFPVSSVIRNFHVRSILPHCSSFKTLTFNSTNKSTCKEDKEVRLLHLIYKGQLFDYIQRNKLGKIRVDVLCTPTADI